MPCPFHKLRSDLPPLTNRIAKLPVDGRGYPVPYFVTWINGEPEFRMADMEKWKKCVRQSLCWVCGQPLGKFKAFTIGPMCVVNKTTAEPPEHLDCARWSVKGCPFLSRPNMVRREDDFTEKYGVDAAGIMIKRNPGVIAIWVTKKYSIFKDGNRGALINIGNPESVEWWKEGRPATREEVLDSMKSGLPLLEAQCRDHGDTDALRKMEKSAQTLIPA